MAGEITAVVDCSGHVTVSFSSPGWMISAAVTVDGTTVPLSNPNVRDGGTWSDTASFQVDPGETFNVTGTDKSGGGSGITNTVTLTAPGPCETTTTIAATTIVAPTTTAPPVTEVPTTAGETPIPTAVLPSIPPPTPVVESQTSAPATTAVVQTTVPTGNTLPATGAPVGGFAFAGSALLLCGAAMIAATHRRRPAR